MESGINRRAFIRSSGAGLAGLALTASQETTASRGNETQHSTVLPTAIIAAPVGPGDFDALVTPLSSLLEESGYVLRHINAAVLHEHLSNGASKPDLLVLTDAARLPAQTILPVTRFLRSGGHCIALNTPAWRERLVQVEGEWMTAAALEKDLLRKPAPSAEAPQILAVAARDTHRGSEAGPKPVTACPGPNPQAPGLAIEIEELLGWDDVSLDAQTFRRVTPDAPLTVLAAKGDTNTTRLALRWHCDDGSVWSTTLHLDLDWQLYVVSPKMFAYRYGGPADRAEQGFDPARAQILHVAQDLNETGRQLGPRQYCIALAGAASMDSAYGALATGMPLPELETLAPVSKGFELDDVHILRPETVRRIPPNESFALPSSSVWSPHVRPQAGGFGSERTWRWMPLIEARNKSNEWRGTPATLVCFSDGPFRWGMWASFGVGNAQWYLQPSVQTLLSRVARRMNTGLAIMDGGADKYTYFEDQPVELGIRAANLGRALGTDLSVRVRVYDEATGELVHATAEWPIVLEPGESQIRSETWATPRWGAAGLRVRAELLHRDSVIDAAEHEAHVWRPPQTQHWVRSEKGGLTLDGRPWRIHGVNYFPASAVALDVSAPDGPGTFTPGTFEFWTRPDAYDPEIVQRDLERIKALGFNALSATLWCQTSDSQNPLDFLRRASNLGFKVNLAIRYPGHTNLTYDWDAVKAAVERLRLWEHDSIFAIDVDWEPMFFPWLHERLAPGWEAWVVERYGSVEKAENRWGTPICRNADGSVRLYEPHMLDSDGPWRIMIAALRRYLDTVLYAHYSRVRRDIHSRLPHALVSFRMHSAGDPSFHWNQCIAFDFAYLGGAVDLFEPEGYSRKVSWERVERGLFTVAYARWANPDLPVFWAEAGTDTWVEAAGRATPWSLEHQRHDGELFYRMLIASRSDGVAWWWWPGGCRYGETSDHGLMNPGGTPRPVCNVVETQGPAFLEAESHHAPVRRIEFDRDRHVDGVRGIYSACKDTFRSAIAKSEQIELRTAGTGTDSRNCPPLAVGGAPWNGAEPPKYLDAFFDTVEVRNGGGWQPVSLGETCRVTGHGPFCLRIAVTNLGEAAWLSPLEEHEPKGTVSLVIAVAGQGKTRIPMPRRIERFGQVVLDTCFETHADIIGKTLELRLDALERSPFGPRGTLRIGPGDKPE